MKFPLLSCRVSLASAILVIGAAPSAWAAPYSVTGAGSSIIDADPLSVPAPDYTSLEAAVTAVNSAGSRDATTWTFLIRSDLAEANRMAIKVDVALGGSIIFRPAPSTSPTVTFNNTAAPATSDFPNGQFSIGGSLVNSDDFFPQTQRIIIDGSNTPGKNSRDMTWQTTSAASSGQASVIDIYGNSQNNVVRNLRVINNHRSNNAHGISLRDRPTGATATFPTLPGQDLRPHNNTVSNNDIQITGGASTTIGRGVNVTFAAAVGETLPTTATYGLVIEDNDVSARTTGIRLNHVGGDAIGLGPVSAAIVRNNRIRITAPSGELATAIEHASRNGTENYTLTIDGNVIDSITTAATGAGHGIRAINLQTGSNTAADAHYVVTNNIIGGFNFTAASASTTLNCLGISVNPSSGAGATTLIANNSVSIGPSVTNVTSAVGANSAAVRINTNGVGVTIRNNVLRSTHVQGFALAFSSTLIDPANITLDNNVYFHTDTSGNGALVRVNGTPNLNYDTLVDWLASPFATTAPFVAPGVTKDAATVVLDPTVPKAGGDGTWVSVAQPANLRFTDDPDVAGTDYNAVTLAAVTTDVDETVRPGSPTKGADEPNDSNMTAPANYAFTGIPAVGGSAVTESVTISNAMGAAPLIIRDAFRVGPGDDLGSGMIQVAPSEVFPITIPGGSSTSLDLTLTPAMADLSVDATIRLYTNDPDQPTADIAVTGSVLADCFEFVPDTVNVPVGTSTGHTAAVSAALGCTVWTASTSTPWITLTTANGSGAGTVVFDINQANPGSQPRVGTITLSSSSDIVYVTQQSNSVTINVRTNDPAGEDTDLDTDFKTIQAAFDSIEPNGLFFGAAASGTYDIYLESWGNVSANIHDVGDAGISLTGNTYPAGTTINIRSSDTTPPIEPAVVSLGFPGGAIAGWDIADLRAGTGSLALNVSDLIIMPSVAGKVPGDLVGTGSSDQGDAVKVRGDLMDSVFTWTNVMWCAADATDLGTHAKGRPGSIDGLQPYDPLVHVRFGDDGMFCDSNPASTTAEVTSTYTNCIFTQMNDEGLLAFSDTCTVNGTSKFTYNRGRGLQIGGFPDNSSVLGTPGTPIVFLENNQGEIDSCNHVLVTNGIVNISDATFTHTNNDTVPDIFQLNITPTFNNAIHVLTVSDSTFSGNAFAPGNATAIDIRNGTVDGCTIEDYPVGIDVLAAGSGAGDENYGNVTIQNSTIQDCPTGAIVWNGIGEHPGIINCLIANNGPVGVLLAADRLALQSITNSTFIGHDTHIRTLADATDFPATPLNIANCSFHNNAGFQGAITFGETGLPDNNSAQIVNIVDCIFSGEGIGNAEVGLDATFKGTGAVNVTYSSIVTAGPNALDTIENDPSNLIGFGTGVINTDPAFTSVTLGAPGFLEVTNCAYVAASSTAGALVGDGTIDPSCVPPVLDGDADNDGDRDVADVTLIFNVDAGIIGSVPGDGDINEDTAVNATDANLLIQFLVNGTPLP